MWFGKGRIGGIPVWVCYFANNQRPGLKLPLRQRETPATVEGRPGNTSHCGCRPDNAILTRVTALWNCYCALFGVSPPSPPTSSLCLCVYVEQFLFRRLCRNSTSLEKPLLDIARLALQKQGPSASTGCGVWWPAINIFRFRLCKWKLFKACGNSFSLFRRWLVPL